MVAMLVFLSVVLMASSFCTKEEHNGIKLLACGILLFLFSICFGATT